MLLKRINWWKLLLVAIDVVILNLCIFAAFWLRFEGDIPPEYWRLCLDTAVWATPLLIAVACAFGLYNRIWEYASLDAAVAIMATVSVTVAIVATISFLTEEYRHPRSVIALMWGLGILTIGGTRFGWRYLREILYPPGPLHEGKTVRVLIYGAGSAGAMLARQMRDDRRCRYQVVGFLDDKPRLRGMVAAGRKVLGTGADLEAVIRRHDVEEVVAALPSAAGERMRELLARGRSLGVTVRTIPRLVEVVNGQQPLNSMREIRVADLLGRDTRHLTPVLHADYISGRTVLVTGAGGSIGSEICRQLCRYAPGHVVLLGRGENRIHQVYYYMLDNFPAVKFTPVICNITSPEAVDDVLTRHRPQVILHAGAHKHVYLMEVNAVEAARNNVLGTAILADLAESHRVERFIFVSTDKAAEPASVMGATKRLCERLLVAKNEGPSTTKFMAVRFGNVLGSSGSVLPIFQACAAAGRPIPVTHPDVDRFFMTVEEAAFLVLQAGSLGKGGEVFVLDMGPPISIVDLARTVLEMSGQDPEDPKAIRFIGLRAGEKLHESLVGPGEELTETECPLVRQVSLNGSQPPCMPVPEALERLQEAVVRCDEAAVREVLREATGGSLG